MKRKYLAILTGLAAIVSLSSCKKNKNQQYVYEDFDFRGAGYLECDYLACKHLSFNLGVGESQKIEIESFPTSFATSKLIYTSLNPGVVTVDGQGNLTGVAKGICDVKIESLDGSVSQYVRVSVSQKSTKSGSSAVLDNISARYDEITAPKKVLRYEYSYERYSKEGKIDHGMDSYEIMGYDAAEGYFFVEGPSLTYRTVGGTPEISDGKWIMYCMNDGLMTRLVHITPTVKNYYDMNTAEYGSNDRIIRDIINFFFVSGEEILDNLLDAYHGKDAFDDLNDSSSSFYPINENSIFMSASYHYNNLTTDADDELNYFDIPAGTTYSEDIYEHIINVNANTKAMEISLTMNYTLDDVNWKREFYRSQTYEADFEHVTYDKPSDMGFKLVDSIYDL